jgi:hypothetical protein
MRRLGRNLDCGVVEAADSERTHPAPSPLNPDVILPFEHFLRRLAPRHPLGRLSSAAKTAHQVNDQANEQNQSESAAAVRRSSEVKTAAAKEEEKDDDEEKWIHTNTVPFPVEQFRQE